MRTTKVRWSTYSLLFSLQSEVGFTCAAPTGLYIYMLFHHYEGEHERKGESDVIRLRFPF